MSIRNWLGRWLGRRDPDLRDEIQEHIEIETRENIELGMSPADARRAAERTFGNSGVTRELVREAKPLYWLDTLAQDVRYGLRHLRHSPLIALSVVATLTLGIGLNVAAFAIMQAALFRAHVERDADRFLRAYPQTWNKTGHLVEDEQTTYDDYVAYRDAIHGRGELAAYGLTSLILDDQDVPPLPGTLVSCNFFSAFGMQQAKLGRLLRDEECNQPTPTAIVSEEIWESRFGRDPNIVGRVIHVNGQALTIVGIVPVLFSGGRDDPSVFVPYTMQPLLGVRDLLHDRSAAWLRLAGKLAPGHSRAEAQTQLAVFAQQQDKLQPARRTTMIVTDGSQMQDPGLESAQVWAVYVMVGAPSLVLLTACANVATLLLSRAISRRREISVRLSLGAGRMRLLRMLLTEVMLLAGISAALSAWLAYRGPQVLMYLMAVRQTYSMAPDWRVFAYLGATSLLAGGLAGMAPAIEALKVDLASSMKGQDGLMGAMRGGWRARDTLVATQVALSLVLLASAGMVVRAYYKLFTDNPGFETEHVMSAGVRSRSVKYTQEAPDAFWRVLFVRTGALPGVQSVASASTLRGGNSENIRLPGQDRQTQRPAALNIVSPAYFDTMGIGILRGRTFTAAEAEQVNPKVSPALVSARLAQLLWPGQDAIGKVFLDSADRPLEVVGVARDTKSGLFFASDFQVYEVRTRSAMGDLLLVRFTGDAQPLSLAIRKTIRGLEPQTIPAPQTLQALLEQSTDHLWRASRVVTFLASLPVIMSLLAIYGVAAFAVTQRTREIGIRMALGARRVDVMRLIAGSSARPILAGLVAGLLLAVAASFAISKGMQHAPAQIDAQDPMVYVAACMVLAVTAVVAMLGPARRAASADPVKALRHE